MSSDFQSSAFIKSSLSSELVLLIVLCGLLMGSPVSELTVAMLNDDVEGAIVGMVSVAPDLLFLTTKAITTTAVMTTITIRKTTMSRISGDKSDGFLFDAIGKDEVYSGGPVSLVGVVSEARKVSEVEKASAEAISGVGVDVEVVLRVLGVFGKLEVLGVFKVLGSGTEQSINSSNSLLKH